MEKKSKINAKKFLEDFRSGKSDQELMSIHGLDQKGYNKVLQLLVQRKLLDQAELIADHSFAATDIKGKVPSRKPPSDLIPPLDNSLPSATSTPADSAKCPQCGAAVNRKVLTCPECGHVLPGEERWANVEPDKKLFDRVPPKVLGILLALPIAALLFYVFRDMIIPMAEVKIEKRQEELKDVLEQSRGPIRAAKEITAQRGVRALQAIIERLTGQDIIQSVEPDYGTFVVGPRWYELSSFDKEKHLSEIRAALVKANLAPEFDVNDTSGGLLVRVKKSSMSFGRFDSTTETAAEYQQIPDASPDETQDTAGAKDYLRKSLERRLAPPDQLPE